MGTREDMNWLKTNEAGWGRIFKLIAGKGKIGVKKLKEMYGGDDWWPVKAYVDRLVERGLVRNEKGDLSLTEQGKNVFDMFKAMGDVHAV